MGTQEGHRLAVVIVEVSRDITDRLVGSENVRPIHSSASSDVAGMVERERAGIVLIASRDGSTDVRELCRALRGDPRTAGVPLLVWARRGTRDEELDAFSAGADDYIAGSPPVGTVVARLHAIARRSRAATTATARMDHAVRLGSLCIEPDSYCVRIDGRSVGLTAGEFRLLWKLALRAGAVVTNDQLARVNPHSYDLTSDKSIRSYVASLRRKLGPAAAAQLKTVRGVGYRLTGP
jgi:DNA-binding response OmpR family regulator